MMRLFLGTAFAVVLAAQGVQAQTEFYLDRIDVYAQSFSSVSASGVGIVETEETFSMPPWFEYTHTVETEVPFDDYSYTTGLIGLRSSTVSSAAGSGGSATGNASMITTIDLPPVEQMVDGPSMMSIGNYIATTDHPNEIVNVDFNGTMTFFCRWIIASNIHLNGAWLSLAVKCKVGWNNMPGMTFFLEVFWILSGGVDATVYSTGSTVCIDQMTTVWDPDMMIEMPSMVTICSSETFWDPIGGIYVDLNGEGQVGQTVLFQGSSGSAYLSSGAMGMASGENDVNIGASIVDGLCWMQLGNHLP